MRISVLVSLLLLAACAAREPRCDGALRRIGAPMPPTVVGAADMAPR
jgi:hypothetical protein